MSKKQNGFRAPLSASQNFLTSRRTVVRVVKLAKLNAKDHVIEIGPGKGHITRVLAESCGRVTAVELDPRLFQTLEKKFENHSSIHLIQGDFLNMPLPGSHAYKIFANIPFSITSEIIRKITEARNPPTDAWLVVEKGAAKRFMGLPRENLRSLMLKPFFECVMVYHFNRNDFHPAPSVDTVLLHLRRKEQPDIPLGMRASYALFLRTCLSSPRGYRALLTYALAAAALRKQHLPPVEPGGETLYVQWLCLFRFYARML